jgi:hypothetical protein
MRRALLRPAVLAVLAVSVAGCSGSGRGPTTDSVHEQAVKFAECMRSNGVTGFPDPTGSGALTIDGVVNGSSLDPDGAAWKSAIRVCRHLEPAGFTGAKVTPEQRTVRLRFAQCIREHGVPDFPDPTPNGPLVDTNRIPSAATASGMSLLNAAMHTCGGVFAGTLGLNGK